MSSARSVVAVLLLSAVGIAGAQGPSARLVGDVVSREAGNPLGHSMVTLVGPQRQTFTSDAGVFAFASLAPGTYRIRAVHIGYTPMEVSVVVPADAPPPRVKIELTHVAVQLAAVKVFAPGVCTVPGRPNPDREPDFAAIFAQLRLNAEQYQLLTDSFPFKYKVAQTYHNMHSDSSRVNARMETETFQSNHAGWAYHMGDVIEHRGSETLMDLPTLRDFASYEFLNNHCFQYAGLDTTRDGTFIRIAFQADVQIKTPDVSGSVYLDAKTYQIRRAELHLTKIPQDLPQVTAVKVTTVFGEVSPNIDIIQEVHGITSLHHSRWFPGIVATTEDQRMYDFEWLRDNPARPTVQP